MNKKNLIIIGAVVAAIVVYLMIPGTPSPEREGSISSAEKAKAQAEASPKTDGPPFTDPYDFQIYFEQYKKGQAPDPSRIQTTLKKHPEWLEKVMPEDFDTEFQSVKNRRFAILYPFMSVEDIKKHKLIQVLAAWDRELKDIKTLVDRGASVNEPGTVCAASTLVMLEYLLSKGASANQEDERGNRPYDTFSWPEAREFRLLIEKHGGTSNAK